MTFLITDHFYKRGLYVRWNAKGLRFAYVGRRVLFNRGYFFNV